MTLREYLVNADYEEKYSVYVHAGNTVYNLLPKIPKRVITIAYCHLLDSEVISTDTTKKYMDSIRIDVKEKIDKKKIYCDLRVKIPEGMLKEV